MSFFLLLLLGQSVVAIIVIAVLRVILNRMLLDLAVRHIESWNFSDAKKVKRVIIFSHKPLNVVYRNRVQKVVDRNFSSDVVLEFKVERSLWGGAVVAVDDGLFDCSLKDRWHRALTMR
ncbi:MAG TPA: F0F1 ATP synthase subunit delta [Candidatus Bathyarchaeia archaeon]|nr:F0F1 ATP synthase subunit delta [Candidatus Bathyarchaeia archaeon]